MGCSFQFVYTEKKPAGLKNQQSWCLLKKNLRLLPLVWVYFSKRFENRRE